MGLPTIDVLSAVPGWARYFLFLIIMSGDSALSFFVSAQGVDNQGVFGGIITFVIQNLFGVQGFVITSFNLLIIAVLSPIILYMFRNAP